MERLTKLIALLCALAPVAAKATDLHLSWQPPTAYTNATPIPAGTVISYNIYAGPCGGTLALVSGMPITITTNTRFNVDPGSWGYAVTAIVNGIESEQTAPICATVAPPRPSAPLSFKVETFGK